MTIQSNQEKIQEVSDLNSVEIEKPRGLLRMLENPSNTRALSSDAYSSIRSNASNKPFLDS